MPTSRDESTLNSRRKYSLPLLVICILGLGVVIAGAAYWWATRPIQATILSPPEKEQLETKLAAAGLSPDGKSSDKFTKQDVAIYTPGEKVIVLSERELNGLFHSNTGLGDQFRIELVKDAVHARINADIPSDFPIMAGKKLKGRARFLVADESGQPTLVLEDCTIWGISLPNAWLGNIKGENLFESLFHGQGESGIVGVCSIKVQRDEIRIELED